MDRLPTFFVIGASKSGTTSLHEYLASHPEIEMTAPKEPHVFCGPEPWRERLSLYAGLFEQGTPLRGDASPGYAALPYDREVPGRIAAAVPDARLVYLVRDPVERAVAHYAEHLIQRLEDRPVEVALGPDSIYVAASRYGSQVDAYRAHFDAERLLVVDSLELREDRRAALGRIFAHVGADPDYWDSAAFEVEHYARGNDNTRRTGLELAVRRNRVWRRLRPLVSDSLSLAVRRTLRRRFGQRVEPTLDEPLRERLAELLGPEAARLREVTGQPFSHWSV